MFPVVTVFMVVKLLRVIKSTRGSNIIVPLIPNGAKNSKTCEHGDNVQCCKYSCFTDYVLI